MKKFAFFIILSLLMTLLIPAYLSATTRGIRVIAKTGQSLYLYKDYHALVVGVSDYEKWPRLPNAVNDAKEVASKLKELGFEVKLVLDPTSREMKTVLNEMVYKMGTEENRALLFYYAGHGETEILADKTKMGYIIPKDCPLLDKDPMGFATHAISMRDIESVSMRIKSKHVLMLFDSCFSGSLFALVRAVPDDITEKSALPVRQYITAGREDEQVPDKSMFKRCFLLGLEGDADLSGDGYITGSELGMYLSDKVVNYTHRNQHPQYGKINNPDLDRGDFIFALKAPSQRSTKIPAAPSPSLEAEKQRLAEERERLERERQELERLKMEIERKKLEEERRRLEAESKRLEKEKRLTSIPKPVIPTPRPKASPSVRLIDNFEDRDLYTNEIFHFANWTGKGSKNTTSLVQVTSPGYNSFSCLEWTYDLDDREWVNLKIHSWNNPIDLSRYRGISFYIKRKKTGFFSSKNDIRLRIFTVDPNVVHIVEDDWELNTAGYETDPIISPSKDWKKVYILFDKLSMPQWYFDRHPEALSQINWSQVRQLGFVIYGEMGSNTIWIDDLRLEK